jgi:hypothetical protein
MIYIVRSGSSERKKPAAVVEVPHHAPNAKPRTCSGCGESFLSDWSGHRVCAGCKSRPDWHLSNPFECDRSVALPRNGAPIERIPGSNPMLPRVVQFLHVTRRMR